MSPSADPASPRADAAGLVPADLLGDGEVVILAVKPSNWHVLIVSLPVLASAAVVAATGYVVNRYQPRTPEQLAYFFAAVASMARLALGCWQWLGRTYLLTNLRVACVRGLLRVSVASAPLATVTEVVPAVSLPERAVGVGSIYCFTGGSPLAGPPAAAVGWNSVANPDDVHRVICQAVRRAKHSRETGAGADAGGR